MPARPKLSFPLPAGASRSWPLSAVCSLEEHTHKGPGLMCAPSCAEGSRNSCSHIFGLPLLHALHSTAQPTFPANTYSSTRDIDSISSRMSHTSRSSSSGSRTRYLEAFGLAQVSLTTLSSGPAQPRRLGSGMPAIAQQLLGPGAAAHPKPKLGAGLKHAFDRANPGQYASPFGTRGSAGNQR